MFIDDFSKYCYVFLLYSKDQVLDKLKIYKSEVENFCDIKLNASEVIKEVNICFLNFVNLLAFCMKLVLYINHNKMT